MVKRALGMITAAVAAIGAVVAVSSPADADSTGTTPFYAVGTVAEDAAPVGPAPNGESASFILNPVTGGSPSALEHVTADGLQIFVTPSTSYLYKAPGDSKYKQSTYAQVVVEGADVRAAGRRIIGPDGTARFIARAVWNPPNDPPPPGSIPDCTADTEPSLTGLSEGDLPNNLHTGNFNIRATITSANVNLPCTGFGGYGIGFKVEDFTEPMRARVEEAAEAYDFRLHIYTSPTTRFLFGDEDSTHSRVVRRGHEVRVLGRYQYINGGWIFVARTVFTPAPDRPDTLNPRANVSAVETSAGHYEGPSNGPQFGPGGEFRADIVWSSTPTGWTASGSWVLSHGGQVLRGLLSGDVEGNDLEFDLEVTSGEGQWHGATGLGEMEGDVLGVNSVGNPSAFNGLMKMSVILDPPEDPPAP